MKNPHAQALGSLGGQSKSEAKKKASAENGKKGGRPTTLALIEKEISRCHDTEYGEDGMEFKHAPMQQGTYLDGLIFARNLLKK